MTSRIKMAYKATCLLSNGRFVYRKRTKRYVRTPYELNEWIVVFIFFLFNYKKALYLTLSNNRDIRKMEISLMKIERKTKVINRKLSKLFNQLKIKQ